MANPTLICFQNPPAKDPSTCNTPCVVVLNDAPATVNLILSGPAPAGGMSVIVNTATPQLFKPTSGGGWPTTVNIPAGKSYWPLSLTPTLSGGGSIFACSDGTTDCGSNGPSAYVRSFADEIEVADVRRSPFIQGSGMGMPIFFQAVLPSLMKNPDGSYTFPLGSGAIPVQAGIDQLPSASGVSAGPGSGPTIPTAPPSNRLLISADNPTYLIPPPDDAGRPGTFPYVVNFTNSYFQTVSFTLGPGAINGKSVTLSLYAFPTLLVYGLPVFSGTIVIYIGHQPPH